MGVAQVGVAPSSIPLASCYKKAEFQMSNKNAVVLPYLSGGVSLISSARLPAGFSTSLGKKGREEREQEFGVCSFPALNRNSSKCLPVSLLTTHCQRCVISNTAFWKETERDSRVRRKVVGWPLVTSLWCLNMTSVFLFVWIFLSPSLWVNLFYTLASMYSSGGFLMFSCSGKKYIYICIW